MNKIMLFLISIFLLSSCGSFDRFIHPDDYIPRDSPREKEYIHDTITISNNSGEMNAAIPGVKPSKQLTFTKIGQSYNFKSGETLEIISDGVDFSHTTFDIETDESTNVITLKLVDKDFTKILITKKCQTITRTGINYVPKVEVVEGLNPEQIIVTPLFDDQCNKIGYEVRYGSLERGCKEEGSKNYQKYKCCRDKKPPTDACNKPPRGGNSASHSDCSLCKKLGLPCPCK